MSGIRSALPPSNGSPSMVPTNFTDAMSANATALVGYLFGPVHLTMLNGFVFFGHQVGSFFGGWGGGKLFDLQGSYDTMWWLSIGLGVLSALLHWPIVEKPVARPQLAASPA